MVRREAVIAADDGTKDVLVRKTRTYHLHQVRTHVLRAYSPTLGSTAGRQSGALLASGCIRVLEVHVSDCTAERRRYLPSRAAERSRETTNGGPRRSRTP